MFNEDKLIQMKDDMNELFQKCNLIVGILRREYRDQVECYKGKDMSLFNRLSWNYT